MPAVRMAMLSEAFEQHKQADVLKRRKHSRSLPESAVQEVTVSSEKELAVPA